MGEFNLIDINKLKIGDRLQVENSEWRVLDIQDEKALIWKTTNCERGIFDAESTDYNKSNIKGYLEEIYTFKLPSIIKNCMIGNIFLLSIDELMKYLPNKTDRLVTNTNGKIVFYWTASPSQYYPDSVWCIGNDGGGCVAPVYDRYYIAPACWISL